MMYVYSICPIDMWVGWMTEVEFIRHLKNTIEPSSVESALAEYQSLKKRAMDAAYEAGWEGDIRPDSGPFVSGIPDPDCGWSSYMIAWKQDNNGTTFIASPCQLPHLGRVAVKA